MSATPNPAFPLTEPPDSVLERICDAFYELCGYTGSSDGVTLLDVHQHNAVNHTLSGTVDVDGTIYGFIVENGDWNGTVVRRWGDPEDVSVYQPEPPGEPLTFVPDWNASPSTIAAWHTLRRTAAFTEKVGAYAYDRHFAPGGATEKHYRAWAAERGLVVGHLSVYDPSLTP